MQVVPTAKATNWGLFILLSFIWGSSFILIKEGLVSLSAYQVASLRIFSAGLMLMPMAFSAYKQIPRNKIFLVFLSGVLGSLLPAYLFCIAEESIDSALAGVLNSLTPIFVIIVGAFFFQAKTSMRKVLGIVLAFCGSILLFLSQPGFAANSNALHVLLVVIATLMYGVNVNIVHRHLANIPSLKIAALALSLNAIPAFIVLFITGFFSMDFLDKGVLVSSGYSILLGIFGTTLATILFYMLIKKAGAVFSSMVTYAIPLVAIMWGIAYGEHIGWKQVASLIIILLGVFIANYKGRQANEL